MIPTYFGLSLLRCSLGPPPGKLEGLFLLHEKINIPVDLFNTKIQGKMGESTNSHEIWQQKSLNSFLKLVSAQFQNSEVYSRVRGS